MAIFFDNNSTTPLNACVLEAMMPYLTEFYANPSSIHTAGRKARDAIEAAREQVADLIQSHPSQVIFTSGGTEANNLAIRGTVCGMGLDSIAVSAIEHPSVRDVVFSLQKQLSVQELDANSIGQISLDSVAKFIESNRNFLMSVMLANNETGCIQPVPAIAEMVRSSAGIMHTDAVQAAGKIDVNFEKLGVHMMTLSSHKIYGPKGAGALIYDKAIDIAPLIFGGGQEKKLRSGTENVAAIVGFGQAAELAKEKLKENYDYLLALRARFETQLKDIPDIVLFGDKSERLPNTTFFSLKGIDGETLLMQLDTQGIEVASGSACGSNNLKPSHVLAAMGIDETLAKGAIRVSFGLQNTPQEVDELIDFLKKMTNISTSH